MSTRTSLTWCFVVAVMMIGASCGSGDSGSAADTPLIDDAAEATSNDTVDNEPDTSDQADDTDAADVGFGELIEGSFLLTGAVEERHFVGDDDRAFRLGGGCQGDQFGFSVNITDAAATTSYAVVSASLNEDLSGGVTGEFDDVDADVVVFPGGDMSQEQAFDGPLRMIISEHDTGGVDSALNDRRMTVTLLGALPSDDGDLDVDVTFQWVMACP